MCESQWASLAMYKEIPFSSSWREKKVEIQNIEWIIRVEVIEDWILHSEFSPWVSQLCPGHGPGWKGVRQWDLGWWYLGQGTWELWKPRPADSSAFPAIKAQCSLLAWRWYRGLLLTKQHLFYSGAIPHPQNTGPITGVKSLQKPGREVGGLLGAERKSLLEEL